MTHSHARGPSPAALAGRLLALAGRLLAVAGGLLAVAGGLLALGDTLPANSLVADASGAPSVSLHTTLAPEVAGHSTTIDLSIRVAPSRELVPPPLIEGELRYPAGFDVQLSGLGIDACTVATLELSGPAGCPPDSRMGYGSAVAELAIKGEVFRETARIAVVRADEQHGHQAMLLYIYGETGLSAQVVLMGELLPASAPFGGLLDIHVPLVPTFPGGAADASVTELRLVLGPQNLTYYERVRGRRVSYTPAGIRLPRHCPRGGFPFAARMRFLGGAEADGSAAVPCAAGESHPPPKPCCSACTSDTYCSVDGSRPLLRTDSRPW